MRWPCPGLSLLLVQALVTTVYSVRGIRSRAENWLPAWDTRRNTGRELVEKCIHLGPEFPIRTDPLTAYAAGRTNKQEGQMAV